MELAEPKPEPEPESEPEPEAIGDDENGKEENENENEDEDSPGGERRGVPGGKRAETAKSRDSIFSLWLSRLSSFDLLSSVAMRDLLTP